MSSVGVYAIFGAGWGRNSKYSFIGAIRAVAQSISYEVTLSLILLQSILFFNYNLNVVKINNLSVFLFLSMLIFFVASLAETNRSPFDFSEGESELVRGFNTEFRSVPFVMIFLAEYTSILLLSLVMGLLFNMRRDVVFFVVGWAALFI